MKSRSTKAFTLIEMLIVVAIIAVLAGIVFQLVSVVGIKTARAKAVNKLEHLKLCIEAYYAVYGQYPPTTTTSYESSDEGRYPPDWDSVTERILDAGDEEFNTYTKGLVYYVMANIKGHGRPKFTDPNSENWREYFEKVGYWQHWRAHTNDSSEWGFQFGEIDFTNRTYGIYDTWLRNYEYRSYPPYQSYRIWSRGPDGRTWDDRLSKEENEKRVADDIGFEGWVE